MFQGAGARPPLLKYLVCSAGDYARKGVWLRLEKQVKANSAQWMVPVVRKRKGVQQLCGAIFACVLLVLPQVAAAEAARGITRVVYEFAVTSYCGTLDAVVTAGYEAEIAAVTRRSGLDPEGARRQRIQGWVEAESEWRNRGLGGNRAWCADEGVAAARHFRAIAQGDKQP